MADRCLKRCLSASDLPEDNSAPDVSGASKERPVQQKRYRGRYSLQRSPVSAGGIRSRRRLIRQRSPKRRSEYLEDLEEYQQYRRSSNANSVGSPQTSSSLRIPTPAPNMTSKSGSERLMAFPETHSTSISHSRSAPNAGSCGGSPADYLRQEVSRLIGNRNPRALDRSSTPSRYLLAPSSDATANNSFGASLWLQLHAYFAGRPVTDRQHVSESIAAHGMQLEKMRKERSAVLREIRQLRLDDFSLGSPVSSTSHNPIELVYSPSYSEHMRLAVARVDLLFERLDTLTQLYPTAKAMQQDVAPLWDASVEQRIAVLNMWSGTVKDLVGKINEAGNYLGLIEGSLAKYTASHSSRSRVFSSPASPLSSPQHLTLPHTPASDDWRQTELWPDSSLGFFSARAVAERLSRSSSTGSPHTSSNSVQTTTHGDNSDAGCTTGSHGYHQNHGHSNQLQAPNSASFTVHMCSDTFTSIYYKVVGKSLRLRGMIEVLRRLEAICRRSLDKAVLRLLVQRKYAQIAGTNEVGRFLAALRKRYEWRNDGATVSSAQFVEMNLPSFYPHFLFLARMPLDLVHQWLKMRAERVVSPEWDLMTLDTLIEDSHDCLQTAIDVKERFINIVESSTAHAGEQLCYLESFDEKLETIFQNYLSYARCWAQTAAMRPSAESDSQEKLVAKLDTEWLNAKRWSANVNRGEITAARRFCEIASDLLNCMVLSYMDEKFDLVDSKLVEVRDEEDYILIDDGDSLKHSSIYVLCRNFKELIREMRRRLLASLGFARKICGDLEICARYTWNEEAGSGAEPPSEHLHSSDQLIDRLVEFGHIVVKFLNHFEPETNEEWPFFVLCNREIVNDFGYIDNLLNATYQSVRVGAEDEEGSSTSRVNTSVSQATAKGYLILVPTKCSRRRIDDFSHHTVSMRLSFLTKCTMAHYITANGIYLISESQEALEHSRRRFELAAGDFVLHGRLELHDDFCSCNDELSSALHSLKSLAFKTMRETWTHARGLGHFILNGRRVEELKPSERSCVRVTLLQAWEAIFESHRELSEMVSVRYHQQFYNETLELVREWSKFFIEATSDDWTNTGHAPVMWAIAPLKCLAEMPSRLFHSRVLSAAEKEVLSDTIHRCVAHLRALEEEAAAYNVKHQYAPEGVPHHLPHSVSAPSTTQTNVRQNPSIANSLATGVGALSFGDMLRRRPAAVRERIHSAVRLLDGTRDETLLAERRIGRVAETKPPKDFHTYFLPHKMRVPFEWQRLENKELGAGSFGKVFLVMNLKDKCLMAVKQIRVQRENNSALRALVDEVDILRQLDHPNLVRYYGAEVHKDEILIFMEYCSEGTLLRVCKEGLNVDCVRQYTYYLLLAIAYLHDHSIVHRDIKPENVFLAQKNVLKLGDFGCSLRLRESRTQVGEVVHHVGTTRYMAPEMQTSGGHLDDDARRRMHEGSQQSYGGEAGELNLYVGYGRGIDIWALACVVLEMLTGKKPYHEMQNEFQIIYHIGLGNAPRIPEGIRKCEMTFLFLQAAFRTDPRDRPTASELLQHPFANIMPHESEKDSLD